MELPIFRNLVETMGTLGKPWQFNPGPEAFAAMKGMNKTRRRLFTSSPECGWCVYSGGVGEIENRRINKDLNPVRKIRAVLFDYDVNVPEDHIDFYLQNVPAAHKPTYIDRSLGGGLHCIYVLEREVTIDGNEHAKAFYTDFAKMVGAETMFPGFDTASLNPTQCMTTGASWKLIGHLVPLNLVEGIAIKSFQRVSKKQATTINLELIAEELENRGWLERWNGEFAIGNVGVRFWDDKADNPRGAMLMEGGVYCLTGDKAFLTWHDIMGRAWMQQHELLQFGRASEDIVYDDKNYWRRLPNGDWAEATADNIKLELKARGVPGRMQEGENMSQVDQILHYIQCQKRVTAAIPLVYHRPGITELEGEKVLNISNIKVLTPIDVTELCKQPPTQLL